MASSINDINNFADLISQFGIEIPMIQRDYVQGRVHEIDSLKERKDDLAKLLLKKYTDEREKRDKFITKLLNALLNPSSCAIQLTFLYGTFAPTSGTSFHQHDSFIPLDGQQRITTLYLLSWALLHCQSDDNRKIIETMQKYQEFRKGLHSLSYMTRPSSRDFCMNLFSEPIIPIQGCSHIHEVIEKQVWFRDDWSLDPTVEAMMQMLDQIVVEIGSYNYDERKTMFDNLLGGKGISFEMLDMHDYQLTDGLYIKMNARGKQLTKFENWKSEFIGFLEERHKNVFYDKVDKDLLHEVFSDKKPSLKEYFEYSIEHQWTDLFWTYCQDDIKEHSIKIAANPNATKREKDCYPVIDEYFMNFFTAAHQTMYYIEHNSEDSKEFQDTLDQRAETFGKADNVKDLFEWLDLLKCFNDSDIYSELFFTQESNQYDHKGLVRLFDGKQVNLLTRCARNENFTVIVQIILYGLLKYAQTIGTENLVNDNLKTYLRQIRNLVEGNSKVCSIRKGSADVVNTCQIIDIYTFKRNIDQLLTAIQNHALQVTGPEQAEIEDFDFVTGSFAPKLFPSKEMSPQNIVSLQSLRDMLKEWDVMDEYSKIAILVAYGYKGKYILSCAHGWTYLYGNNKRWKPIFMRDPDLCPVLVSMLKDYSRLTGNGSDRKGALETMLKGKKAQVQSYGFVYYTLNYKSFLLANPKRNSSPTVYFSIKGDRDTLDICSIPYSGKPMLATHTDPIIYATVEELFKSNTDKTKLYLHFRYYTSGGERVCIQVYRTPGGDNIPPIAEIRHIPGLHGTGGWAHINIQQQETFIEPDSRDQDRVVSGVEFIKKMYPNYDFAEKGV